MSGPALHSVQVTITTTAGRNYLLAGPLADAVEPGQWTQVGMASNFTVFRATYSPQAVWLQPAGSQGSATPQAPGDASAEVVSSSPNTATITTRTTSPELLVWNMAWDPGWRAEIVGGAGDTSLTVERVGLIQGVEVPAGSSTVRFSYEPDGIAPGWAISAVTLGALVVAGVLYMFAFRRRTSSRSDAGH